MATTDSQKMKMSDAEHDDLIGKHLRQLAAEGVTLRQASELLGMAYDVVWRRAKRRGIDLQRSDGTEARKATWAAKRAAMANDVLPDENWKPVNLSAAAIKALYRGRKYNQPETWAK